MQKDFDVWNEKKKKLEEKEPNVLFKEGEIWWCSLGINVAHESCGKGKAFSRPVLVLKKLSDKCCVCIPISRKIKTGTWFADVMVRGERQTALLHQIRMLSANRFQDRLTKLEVVEFKRIKEKLEALLELSGIHQDRSPGSVGCPKCNYKMP